MALLLHVEPAAAAAPETAPETTPETAAAATAAASMLAAAAAANDNRLVLTRVSLESRCHARYYPLLKDPTTGELVERIDLTQYKTQEALHEVFAAKGLPKVVAADTAKAEL